MPGLQGLASRMWPVAAAAAISLALFWGIAVFAQRLTVWLGLSWAESLPHRPVRLTLLPKFCFFLGFAPAILTLAASRKRRTHRGRPDRPWP